MKKRLYDFIEKALKYVKNIAITTNGILITDEDLEILKKKDIRLQFSIDGLEAYHDQIRGEGTFKRTLKNIKKAVEYGLSVNILTTVSRENLSEIPELLKFVDKLGVENVHLLHFTPKGRGKILPEIEMHPEEWMEFVDKVGGFTKNVRTWIQPRFLKPEDLSGLDPERAITKCNHLKYDFAYIDLESGEVYPCGLAYDTELRIGNLKERSLPEIVSSHLKRVDELTPKECAGCSQESVCAGGAKCYALYRYGDILRKDPFCTDIERFIPICPFPAVLVGGPGMKTMKPTVV
jgi:radical SAM protein with 4Fe4S-binding SPASM domain